LTCPPADGLSYTMKFLLFDIDGTLIDSGGAGVRSLNLAFEEMFSLRDAFSTVSMAGKTDPQILGEALTLHGIKSQNGVVPEFYRAYLRHLTEQIENGEGHVKPGMREALDILMDRKDFILGLLTGNIEEGAAIKLEHFCLRSYFVAGAFGSDAEDRNRLLPVAVEKLSCATSIKVPFTDCVIIGDTPRDVDCAKPYGAFSVAVATGPYSSAALSAAGADVVFEDLSDTKAFLSVLQKAAAEDGQHISSSC
jgi:phosphoglycolate phosphatase